MKKLIIPDSKLITTTINSDVADFDFSYSQQIKDFLAEQMDININFLKDIRCAFFSNYVKTSDTFSMSLEPVGLRTSGGFRPLDNLLLICVDDFDIDERLLAIIHEAGHALSLNYLSVSIAEGCALNYERKWAQKNNKMDKFNLKYNSKSIEPYYYSLKLFDMIRESVFENNNEDIQRCTRAGAHDEFTNKIDNYLNFIGCNITVKELLFLIDVAFYNRIDKQMLRVFKEKPPFFYKMFDELHNDILPVIFNRNSSKEQINDINNRLIKYKELIILSFNMLQSLKDSMSYIEFSIFIRLYQKNLAKQFKKLDIKAYFQDSFSEESTIKDSIINAFDDTSNMYNLSFQNKIRY